MSEINLTPTLKSQMVLRIGYKLYKSTWPLVAVSDTNVEHKDLVEHCIKAAEAWVNVAQRYEDSGS